MQLAALLHDVDDIKLSPGTYVTKKNAVDFMTINKIDGKRIEAVCKIIDEVSFAGINYGYIEGVMAPDGEEQDAYILGVNEPVDIFTGKIIAIIDRKNDIEQKWVVVTDGMMFSKDEIRQQIHFQEQYFDSEIVM